MHVYLETEMLYGHKWYIRHELTLVEAEISNLRWCSTKHVETMVISLRIRHLANTRSLKQISSDSSSGNPSILVKLNLHKLTKTTAVFKGCR